MANKSKKGWHTSLGERTAYMMYFAGQLLFNTIVSSFALIYMLNAGISEMVAGSILLIPKIWDAVNDTLFGFLVDKTSFRRGRYLPWIMVSSIIIPLATILLFSMPQSLSATGKCIWVIVGYLIWDTGYTMTDTPIYALLTCMTDNLDERTSIMSVTRITAGLGGMLAAILIPMMYGSNGMNLGWSKTAIILSLIGALLMVPAGLACKERFHGEKEEEYTFKELFEGLIQNKNLLVIIFVKFISLLTMTTEVLSGVFAQYVLGNETYGSLMTMAITMPVMILACIMPFLCRKFDKVYIYAVSMGLYALSSIVAYFIGYANLGALVGITLVRGIGYGGLSILALMFIPDCVEYGQYRHGVRNSGTAFALQTFVFKLNGALGASISAWAIALVGFDAANVTEQGKQGVWLIYTIFCAIGSLIAIPLLMKGYKLRDKDVRLMTLCNNGEISRDDCETQLSERIG